MKLENTLIVISKLSHLMEFGYQIQNLYEVICCTFAFIGLPQNENVEVMHEYATTCEKMLNTSSVKSYRQILCLTQQMFKIKL